MKEDTAKKARDIIDKLEHHRTFLEEYDKCKAKIINGKRIPNVRGVDFHVGVEEIPKFTFSIFDIPDIDVIGRVVINPTPENLQQACAIIENELKKHGEFYNSFVASVKTALDEFDDENCVMDNGYESNYLANKIVKRISGEE